MRFASLATALICTANILTAQKPDVVMARMKADVSYLASDQLEGRLSGSPGELRSSLYVADEFRKYKLQPMGSDSGSYFQTFSMVKLRLSRNREVMFWTDHLQMMRGLRPEKGEFYPLAQSCNKDSLSQVPVFFAGYGIQAPELGHNDYKDSSGIRGKVFVIQLGSPEKNVPHGKFQPYEGLNYKVDLAVRMGARGVVFIRPDTSFEAPKGHLDREVKPRSIPVIYADGGDYSLKNASAVSFRVDILQLNATAHNVIGYLNHKRKKTIVIGAHQDHLGYNEFGGSRDPKSGGIHNGADDNASGVAMMMELMRKIKKTRSYKKYNYLFIAFSGEEQGLLGSKYFVNHPVVKPADLHYMLNFDMVGRLDSLKKTLMVYGTGTSPVWKSSLETLKTDSARIRIKTSESGTGSSDHTSFYYANVPVLHFFTGQHNDYHKPSDDEHLINYAGMYECYRVVLQVMASANRSREMPFTATKAEESTRMAFKVSLGIMPDYVFDGAGLKIDGVNPGKPAEKAGLLRGDVITRLGDYSISSIQDYMKALSQFNKGQTIVVRVLRNQVEKEFSVTF